MAQQTEMRKSEEEDDGKYLPSVYLFNNLRLWMCILTGDFLLRLPRNRKSILYLFLSVITPSSSPVHLHSCLKDNNRSIPAVNPLLKNSLPSHLPLLVDKIQGKPEPIETDKTTIPCGR